MGIKGICLEKEDAEYIYLRAAAGEKWHDLVLWTLKKGFGGLENLSWIPGTVGAAPVQNIGAYGVEVQDRFFSLRAFDFESGEIVELGRSDCRFGYRDSIFKNAMKNRLVIVDVTFALPKNWHPNKGYAEVEKELERVGIADPSPAEVGRTIPADPATETSQSGRFGECRQFFQESDCSGRKVVPVEIGISGDTCL